MADLRELPQQAIAAVLIAEIAQIRSDGGTHPDPDARERIKRGSDRLWEFIEGRVTPDIMAKLPRIQEILNEPVAPLTEPPEPPNAASEQAEKAGNE